jgi:hypothetical protein
MASSFIKDRSRPKAQPDENGACRKNELDPRQRLGRQLHIVEKRRTQDATAKIKSLRDKPAS